MILLRCRRLSLVFCDPRLLPLSSGDAAGGDDVLALGRSATCLENERAVLLAVPRHRRQHHIRM